jgi:uncharacterized protein YunC (DUF1805 family)
MPGIPPPEMGNMPLVEHIKLGNGTALGIKVELPKAPLVMIRADKGFAMCGYLNIESVNKAGEVAVRVTGVKSFDDVLNARVINISDEARKLGIIDGMTAREALEKMF